MNRLILLAMPLLLIACQADQPATGAETSETVPAATEATASAAEATTPPAASTDPTAGSAASAKWVKAPVIQTASVLRRYQWHLESANNRAGAPIEALAVRADQPLSVDFTVGSLTVRNACAPLASPIQLSGDTMTVTALAAGEEGCKDAKLQALDAAVLNHLKGKLTIRFAPEAGPKLSLVNEAGDTLIFNSTPVETKAPKAE